MEWPQELLDLFDDPILDGVRPKPAPVTADDRKAQKLLEITAWCEANGGRVPSGTGGLQEKRMARALEALKKEAGEGLAAFDRLNLLKVGSIN